MARRDTSREAEGAEFLVLGLLLAEGIEAHKSYSRNPGYDIVAVDLEADRTCRIQVKSRWATNYGGGFPIKNFDCDFVVFVALNRGWVNRRSTAGDSGRRPPQCFVLPTDVVKSVHQTTTTSTWQKAMISRLPDLGAYEDKWELVRNRLSEP
jgi:hypothetical protein